MNLHIKETWISNNCISGDSDIYETFTNNVGELFRDLQKEHGRVVSKMYQDKKNGPSIQIGWVFEKIRQYTDTGEDYLSETWVEVFKSYKKVPEHIINAVHPFN